MYSTLVYLVYNFADTWSSHGPVMVQSWKFGVKPVVRCGNRHRKCPMEVVPLDCWYVWIHHRPWSSWTGLGMDRVQGAKSWRVFSLSTVLAILVDWAGIQNGTGDYLDPRPPPQQSAIHRDLPRTAGHFFSKQDQALQFAHSRWRRAAAESCCCRCWAGQGPSQIHRGGKRRWQRLGCRPGLWQGGRGGWRLLLLLLD